MTHTEHVLWARRRAHELVDLGRPVEAALSMLTDLSKHADTAVGVVACHLAACSLDQDDPDQIRKWIDDCFPGVKVEARCEPSR